MSLNHTSNGSSRKGNEKAFAQLVLAAADLAPTRWKNAFFSFFLFATIGILWSIRLAATLTGSLTAKLTRNEEDGWTTLFGWITMLYATSAILQKYLPDILGNKHKETLFDKLVTTLTKKNDAPSPMRPY